MRLARAVAIVVILSALSAAADVFDVLPPAQHDAAVPELAKVTGFPFGDEILDPAQIVAYARALAAAAPKRVRLVEYARSLEGRPLVLLFVGSEERIAALDEVSADLVRLGDPRVLSSQQADALLARLPAVVWIMGSVHGDEASGGDAALALAYHLAAGSSPEIERIRRNALVVVDPLENPDGRARFVTTTRQARGVHPDPEPASAEHVQPWPGGRFSHDLFDLNRDWFALTHPETLGRMSAMLHTPPTVVADLHEMGAEEGYYFAPPAGPRHPLVSADQAKLWDLVGRANGAAFDAHGYRFWTREIFDSFYPGYGESWPILGGALGMTFEEASSRGLVTALHDGSLLTYADTVRHHVLAAFTTCLTAADNRDAVLRAWLGYRQAAIADARRGDVRAFVIEPGSAPRRAAELSQHLALQGIEVERVRTGAQDVPAGAFIVPLEQPLGRLARALLERHTSMGEAFEKEQERRESRRLPDEIYDLTAWSLPLLWAIPARPIAALPKGLQMEPVGPASLPGGSVSGEGKIAFVLRWESPSAAQALARLLQLGIKASVATKPFTLQAGRFEIGSIVIRRHGNPDTLRDTLVDVAHTTGAEFVGADSSYAEAGVDLGSTSVVALKPPRILLLWDQPAAPPSAGALRYALERFLGYPVSVVRASSLARAEIVRADVIVLPDTWGAGPAYESALGEGGAKRLAAWVREGGTLVAVGGGAAYLTGEKVGLLASKLEKRGEGKGKAKDKPEEKAETAAKKPYDYERAVAPDEEMPPHVPGAILRVDLDVESWLAAGFKDGQVDVLVDSNRAFQPLKLDVGSNVGVYAEAGSLLQSGFIFAASRELLPRRAYLMLQHHGRGRVIAFAEDPAQRGMTRASMLLLANAVFFGPAGEPRR
jgi:hypothetical protein